MALQLARDSWAWKLCNISDRQCESWGLPLYLGSLNAIHCKLCLSVSGCSPSAMQAANRGHQIHDSTSHRHHLQGPCMPYRALMASHGPNFEPA